MDTLVRRQIREAVDEEWPAMAHQRATLTVISAPLADALQLAVGLSPRTEGQKTAQREIVSSLQSALDARRQRILVSESSVNWVKWSGVILVALLTLVAIAFVHSDNRLTAALAIGDLLRGGWGVTDVDRRSATSVQRTVRGAPGPPDRGHASALTAFVGGIAHQETARPARRP